MRILMLLLMALSAKGYAATRCEASMSEPNNLFDKESVYRVKFTVVFQESEHPRFTKDFHYPGVNAQCGFLTHDPKKGSMIWCEFAEWYVQSDRTGLPESSRVNTLAFNADGRLHRFRVECD